MKIEPVAEIAQVEPVEQIEHNDDDAIDMFANDSNLCDEFARMDEDSGRQQKTKTLKIG